MPGRLIDKPNQYPPGGPINKVTGDDELIHRENAGYTASAVKDALVDVSPPIEGRWPEGFTAYDVWAGYLLLDAWVAGRDRHHENWAVIVRGDVRRLAPTFDHGNALGFQEPDERRLRMLHDGQYFERWLRRGTSPHFSGKTHLITLALQALDMASPHARSYWLLPLEEVDVILSSLQNGAKLELELEADNPSNPLAVIVTTSDGQKIGYLPDWLCSDVRDLIEQSWSVAAVAERINPDAPAHVRVLCRIDAQRSSR